MKAKFISNAILTLALVFQPMYAVLASQVASATSSLSYTSVPFVKSEWAADRTYPTGDVVVAGDGGMHVGIIPSHSSSDSFYKTEGVKRSLPDSVSVKASMGLYQNPTNLDAYRAGFWATITNGTDTAWPIIEYANKPVDNAGFSGWRVWNTFNGSWTNVTGPSPSASFISVPLEVTYNTATSKFQFYIDGNMVHEYDSQDGYDTINGVILNVYNNGDTENSFIHNTKYSLLQYATASAVAPVISDVNPVVGSVVSGTVPKGTLSAKVVGDDIDDVRMFIYKEGESTPTVGGTDGAPLKRYSNPANVYSYMHAAFDTTLVSDGPYQVVVRVKDSDGNFTFYNESKDAHQINVDNTTGPIFNVDTEEYFDTIQEAIDDTDTGNGDTIKVVVPSHEEAPTVEVTKSISLVGNGMGGTVIHAGGDTGGNRNLSSRGWFTVADGETFNVSNLTLDGDSDEGDKVHSAIVYTGASSGVIDSVKFQDIKYTTYVGIAVDTRDINGTVDVKNSVFENIHRIGVFYRGSNVSGTFSGNTYTGKGSGDYIDYALDISAGANVTVTDNTVTNNRGVASDESTSAGFLVTTFYGSGTEATFENNTIRDNAIGIAIGYEEDDSSKVTARYNNITGNDYGISNKLTTNVDVASNWWGDVSGPDGEGSGSGDSVAANATYKPWLCQPFQDGTKVSSVGGSCDSTAPKISNVAFDKMVDIDGVDHTGAKLNNGFLNITFTTDEPLKLVGSQVGLSVPGLSGVPSTGWTKVELVDASENKYMARISLIDRTDTSSSNYEDDFFVGREFEGVKLYFRTVDELNNTDSVYYYPDGSFGKSPSAAYTFTIDNVAPELINVTSDGSDIDGQILGGEHDFKVNFAQDDLAKAYVEYMKLEWAESKGEFEYKKKLGQLFKDEAHPVLSVDTQNWEDGKYRIKVTQIVDKTGNTAQTYTVDFIVDNNAPEGSITYSGGNIDSSDGVRYLKSIDQLSFTGEFSDEVGLARTTYVIWQLDSEGGRIGGVCGNWSASAITNISLSGESDSVAVNVSDHCADVEWTDGLYEIGHRVYDEAGRRTGLNSPTEKFVIDSQPPATDLDMEAINPTEYTLYASDANGVDKITAIIRETTAANGKEVIVPCGKMILANGSTDFDKTCALPTNLADGVYNIRYNATDVAGNTLLPSKQFNFTIDSTKPTLSTSMSSYSINKDTDDAPEVTIVAQDGLTGIDYVQYKIMNLDESTALGWVTINNDEATLAPAILGLDAGEYILRARAYDKAGNKRSGSDVAFSVIESDDNDNEGGGGDVEAPGGDEDGSNGDEGGQGSGGDGNTDEDDDTDLDETANRSRSRRIDLFRQPVDILALNNQMGDIESTGDSDEDDEEAQIVSSTDDKSDSGVLGDQDEKEDWSLANAGLAAIVSLMSLMAIAGIFKKDEDDSKLMRVLTLVPAIGAVGVLLWIEDLSAPMGWFNWWTILFAAIAAVQVVIFKNINPVEE